MPLFIGGPMDGRHVEVERVPFLDVEVEQKDSNLKGRDKSTFTYRLELLACPSRDYRIYVPKEYTCEDVMDKLLNGYTSGVQDTQS